MNAVDDEAARNAQLVHEKLQTGPWNTGALGAKGVKVTEPLDTANPSNQDNVSRYTDRYLRHRVVGRTIEDFSFNAQFLPPELHRIVKLDSGDKFDGASGASSSKEKLEQRIAGMVDTEDGKDEENVEEKDEDEAEEDIEDEFEELDDDDYNAEKYFDDGDDYGDGDDDNNEAAY